MLYLNIILYIREQLFYVNSDWYIQIGHAWPDLSKVKYYMGPDCVYQCYSNLLQRRVGSLIKWSYCERHKPHIHILIITFNTKIKMYTSSNIVLRVIIKTGSGILIEINGEFKSRCTVSPSICNLKICTREVDWPHVEFIMSTPGVHNEFPWCI